MPKFYPQGTPLYWGFEVGGELKAAVKHYFDFCLGHAPDETAKDLGIPPMTEAELELLCEYCVYFINAPCWLNSQFGGENPFRENVISLRERAKTLASLESIRRWNDECTEIGLDPF